LNNQKKIYLLCLSNGEKEIKETRRIKELEKSCKNLNIENFEIINNEKFKDGFENKWNLNDIKNEVENFIKINGFKNFFIK
jgi:LmbE family N-acetylglucosaminyl deacetylase